MPDRHGDLTKGEIRTITFCWRHPRARRLIRHALEVIEERELDPSFGLLELCQEARDRALELLVSEPPEG